MPEPSDLVIRLRARNRRRWLASALACATPAAWTPALKAASTSGTGTLRFGTTPVFLDDQIALLTAWQGYLEQQLGRRVQFVQRGSYREIVDLLLGDGVEAAWLCGHPFVVHEARLSLVAVPRYQGAPLYRSHLIVPVADRSTERVADLRSRVFAYSDPLSNSGYLVPRAELLQAGHDPERFFARSFFTFSHRKVVDAVRSGLADGGAVDGYVWDTLLAQHPEAADGVRVAWRSPAHGFPPVVARVSWAAAERMALTQALLGMSTSSGGAPLLRRLGIDGFVPASPPLFDSIRTLVRLQPAGRVRGP